jgi:hypothetical protein
MDAGSIIAERDFDDTSCNPDTAFGHFQGTHSYFCANIAEGSETPDYHCVSYKTTDYCGKTCSDTQDCSGIAICRFGICVLKVNSKQCERICTVVSFCIPSPRVNVLEMLMLGA